MYEPHMAASSWEEERAHQTWQWAHRSRSASRAPTTKPSKVSPGCKPSRYRLCSHINSCTSWTEGVLRALEERASLNTPIDHSPLGGVPVISIPMRGAEGWETRTVALRVFMLVYTSGCCHERGLIVSLLVWSVELQVKRPLMPVHLSPEQVGLEMLCLCGQLDLLIRAQMQQVAAYEHTH